MQWELSLEQVCGKKKVFIIEFSKGTLSFIHRSQSALCASETTTEPVWTVGFIALVCLLSSWKSPHHLDYFWLKQTSKFSLSYRKKITQMKINNYITCILAREEKKKARKWISLAAMPIHQPDIESTLFSYSCQHEAPCMLHMKHEHSQVNIFFLVQQ